ncbi:MAG: hypothetical protein JSU92_03540 [Deltaproteobacteria bacterium]|nr:MAG: hypothetical protein JSU92_03540 [Deltaproteobacteria bacterium]
MEPSRFDKILDYFPILAYFFFWLQGAAIGAIITGDPRLMKLGFVTLPAIAAMILAVFRIRKRHREDTRR